MVVIVREIAIVTAQAALVMVDVMLMAHTARDNGAADSICMLA